MCAGRLTLKIPIKTIFICVLVKKLQVFDSGQQIGQHVLVSEPCLTSIGDFLYKRASAQSHHILCIGPVQRHGMGMPTAQLTSGRCHPSSY